MNGKVLLVVAVLCIVCAAMALSPANKVKSRIMRQVAATKKAAAPAAARRPDSDYLWATLVETTAAEKSEQFDGDSPEGGEGGAGPDGPDGAEGGPDGGPEGPDATPGDGDNAAEDQDLLVENVAIECKDCAVFVGQFKEDPTKDHCAPVTGTVKEICASVAKFVSEHAGVALNAPDLCGGCHEATEMAEGGGGGAEGAEGGAGGGDAGMD